MSTKTLSLKDAQLSLRNTHDNLRTCLKNSPAVEAILLLEIINDITINRIKLENLVNAILADEGVHSD